MKRRYTPGLSEEAELLNLTPLLDVLFVVLMLFILIAPIMHLDRINLAKSSSKTLTPSAMNEREALNITLDKDGHLTIGDKPIEKETLRILLTQIQKTSKETIPRLFVDMNSSFGAFTETKDLIENCGFPQLDVVVKSKHS